MSLRPIALALAAGLASTVSAQTVVYVNGGLATGNDDGSSWSNAYRTRDGVARALAAAPVNSQIWVAQGTYAATVGASRSASHALRAGVQVFGGFTGAETTLVQRNPVANVTVLTGDILGDDQPFPATAGWAENTYNVVEAITASVDATAVLDGFTIRQGFASGGSAFDEDRGAGVLVLNGATPVIRNCRIVNNRVVFGGGAVYIRGASPSFVACNLDDNFGASFGGAVDAAFTGAPSFVSCTFRNNQAGRAGGVELFSGMNATIVNCLFQNNVATGSTGGGALFIASSSPVIRNTTIAYNRALANLSGGGVVLSSAAATVVANSVLWANQGTGSPVSIAGAAAVSYSIVQNGFAGAGNLAADPLFVNGAATGDLRLQPTSPAIDAGSNPLAAPFPIDLAGLPRFVDIAAVPDTGVGPAPVVDMGAYELQGPPPCYANCDGSTSAPVLNALDFSCFLARYRAGESYANCDGSTAAPTLNALDFACFLTRYQQGCP